MRSGGEFGFDPRVAVARTESPEYRNGAGLEDHVSDALCQVAGDLGWDCPGRGPLGYAIPEGARVVIKPNLVMHQNQGCWGIEPLITHQSLIRWAAGAAFLAGAENVLVGDAPLQSCDFKGLLMRTGLDQWSDQLAAREPRFKGIHDFRRTTCTLVNGLRVASENLQPKERFVLFDLAQDSLLEPISDTQQSFRVTRYDPRLMAGTHAPGRHQYLVAREIVEADVIVNLPKLKTHKKAGVTCSLKNLIGINGNKEYLPHHRIGGSESGGDCYPGGSPIKRALEYSLDRQNMADSAVAGKIWSEIAANLDRLARLKGDRIGVEGSWSGNDTIWRTCLDLNRILLYGRTDGSLAERPQRRVIHLVDAIIAGDGDGPLAPEPFPLGMVLAGENPAAVDWVGAALFGYDPERIPVLREAFKEFRWPITRFGAGDVELIGDLGEGPAEAIMRHWIPPSPISHPIGWTTALRSRARDSDQG